MGRTRGGGGERPWLKIRGHKSFKKRYHILAKKREATVGEKR